MLNFILHIYVFFLNIFLCCAAADILSNYIKDDELVNDTDFLTNVTRTRKKYVVKFGRGSVTHGRDSRYWDRDDRRRDEGYREEDLEQAREHSVDKYQIIGKGKKSNKKSSAAESHRGNGLYNEAGRDELKLYEAEYEDSLRNVGQLRGDGGRSQLPRNASRGHKNKKMVDPDDEYDGGIDIQDGRMDEYDEIGLNDGDHFGATTSHDPDVADSSDSRKPRTKHRSFVDEVDETSADLSDNKSLSSTGHSYKVTGNLRHASFKESQSSRRSAYEKRSGAKKKPKRRKFSGEYMFLLYYLCCEYYCL